MTVMKFCSLIFPQEAYEKLYRALSPRLIRKTLHRNERCNFKSSEHLFVLTQGGVSVISNGFSSILRGPFVYGLTGCLGGSSELSIRACDDTELYIISPEEALHIIRSESLWEEVGRIITYNNMLVNFVHFLIRNPSVPTRARVAKAIETICHLQKKYDTKPFLAKEIMSLTLLSRSVVMKYISFFKKNNIIDVYGGYLTHLDEDKLHNTCLNISGEKNSA